MVLQVLVDVRGEQLGDLWPHAVLQKGQAEGEVMERGRQPPSRKEGLPQAATALLCFKV